MSNNTKLENLVLQLAQRLNPEFLQNNGDLIAQLIETLKEQEEEKANLINLEEFGMEKPEDLLDLVEIVPKYNGLIDEFEALEEAFEEMKEEGISLQYQLGKLKNALKRSDQDKKKHITMLGEAKKIIQDLKGSIQGLRSQNQQLKFEIKTKDQLMDRLQSWDQTPHRQKALQNGQ